MKAVWLGIFLAVAVPAYAFASQESAYQAGDIVVGLGLKTSSPGLGTDWGEFNVENKTSGTAHDAKPGEPSLGIDIQAAYFLTQWLAVGISLGDEYFDHEVASGVNMGVDTRVYNYLFLTRVFLNPNQKFKVYVPLAVGAADISSRIYMHPKETFDYRGFAAHAGLGVARVLNERWGWAFEMRYNYNKFHRTRGNARGEVYRIYPNLNYVSMSLRADYRF